jgi:hypothetical protein
MPFGYDSTWKTGTMTSASSSIRSEVFTKLPTGTNTLPKYVQRLIVLVLDIDFDANELARRIWQLASSTHSQVLLLGLCPDASGHMILRRQLVSIAAAIRDNTVEVEIMVIPENSWVEVERLWQDGDLIVSLAEKHGRIINKTLSKILNLRSQMPIYIMTGIHPAIQKRPKFFSQVALWLGTAGIFAVFFWMQVQIEQLPENWGQTTLLILSVIVEIPILLVWNSIIT